jgi:DNA-directed RNA polymerase specialized sigma24 family protein
MAGDQQRGGPRGKQRGASSRAAKGAKPPAKGARSTSAAKPAPAEADGTDERVAQLAAPLRKVLERLPATQRKVLELRMGLVDGHPQDPADAARTLGMSLAELREIEARAFERIREVIPLQQLQRFLER